MQTQAGSTRRTEAKHCCEYVSSGCTLVALAWRRACASTETLPPSVAASTLLHLRKTCISRSKATPILQASNGHLQEAYGVKKMVRRNREERKTGFCLKNKEPFLAEWLLCLQDRPLASHNFVGDFFAPLQPFSDRSTLVGALSYAGWLFVCVAAPFFGRPEHHWHFLIMQSMDHSSRPYFSVT